MKQWFRLTLTLVAWALLCLLLDLCPPVELNHPLQVADAEPWFDQGREAASGSPTASVVRSMEFDPARAGPLASVVLDFAWTADNLGPPGQESHGPPEPMGPWRVAAQAGSSNPRPEQPFSTKLQLLTAELKNRGFATAFS
jgi:hypothetical protein